MLIESCALYAMSSLLVIAPWVAGYHGMIVSVPVLSQTQVRSFTWPQYSDRLSDVTTDWKGHRSAAHHTTGFQQECTDEKHRRHGVFQFVQRQGRRGVDG